MISIFFTINVLWIRIPFIFWLQIQGRKFKVVFLDGSEKWAPASRLKQIQCQIPDDDDKCNKTPSISPSASPSPSPCVGVETGVGAVSSVVGPGPKKKTKFDSNGQMKEQLQITCGSCGTQKVRASLH